MTTKYYRPSYINVDLDAIAQNFKAVQRLHPNKTVMAVVKANAYGMGAVQVAGHLMEQGAEFFAVATLDEAIELRMHGIKAKILIMGIIEPKDISKAVRHRVALTVPGQDWLDEALSSLEDGNDKPLWLHVKIDTGMNRIGIHTAAEYRDVVAAIKQHPQLVFEGVFTHFSCADMDSSATAEAYDQFMTMVKMTDEPPFIHCQNSAAALRYDMSECSAIRFGISLYGYYPSPFIKEKTPLKLQPAMQLVSTVSFVKQLSAGESVGYGGVYTAQDDETIATLPIGYGDGFLRSMEGYTININGSDCLIVGRICMDQLMAVVPPDIKVGDKAILIDHHSDGQSMERAAAQQQTISYEVMCNLSRRLPRIYHTNSSQIVYNELLK